MTNLRFASVLSLALCASALATTAHADAFLKLDTIPGESTDATHKDEIVIESFSFGATSSTSPTSGAATGVAKFDALTFTHQVDKASAPLLFAVARGQAFRTAVLSARKTGSPNEYLKVTLNDVTVTSVKVAGSASDVAREEVTLRFAKITYEYFVVQRDGRVVPGPKVTWDIAANKTF